MARSPPIVLLLPTLLWALSFLFMPFSVFGVKSRLEAIESRLDEIQTALNQSGGRAPMIVSTPTQDYDDVYQPARAVEPRIASRPPVPPARHDLHMTPDLDPGGEPAMEDRPPPAANARPVRRAEGGARPMRAEPRLDWRR